MILYNVTLNVDPEIHDEWLLWMKEIHLPEVMATKKFVDFAMYKIQNHNTEDTGLNYSVQYYAKNKQDFEDYVTIYAPELKRKTLEKYGDKVIAFQDNPRKNFIIRSKKLKGFVLINNYFNELKPV